MERAPQNNNIFKFFILETITVGKKQEFRNFDSGKTAGTRKYNIYIYM